MTGLHDILKAHAGNGSLPGAVGLVARGDQVEVAAVGSLAAGGAEMTRDAILVRGQRTLRSGPEAITRIRQWIRAW